MNKKLLSLSLAAVMMSGLASCDSNDDPAPEAVETLQGLYVVNNGNKSGNIPGSMTSYDYTTGLATQDIFTSANGYSIGDMPQSAIVYGSKAYIAVSGSNILWICDANTLKVEGNVKFEGEYSQPRYVVADKDKVYVSLFSGHVAQIDTLTMKMDRAITVGPNPEQMAIAGGKLYVANSDYGRQGGYVSAVDLSTLSQTKIDTSVNPNPVELYTNGTDVVVLCSGNYSSIQSAIYKIENNSLKYICDATTMSMRGDEVYAINYPYSSDPAKQVKAYEVYSVTSGQKLRDMVKEEVDYPSGVNVDPLTGNIVILSYTVSAAGYAQYREPCYARIYDNQGNPIGRFDTGVGSTWVTFLHHTELK